MCTSYNTTLSFQALLCLRSKRVATASWLDMSPADQYSVRVSLSVLKLDLNVKHWCNFVTQHSKNAIRYLISYKFKRIL